MNDHGTSTSPVSASNTPVQGNIDGSSTLLTSGNIQDVHESCESDSDESENITGQDHTNLANYLQVQAVPACSTASPKSILVGIKTRTGKKTTTKRKRIEPADVNDNEVGDDHPISKRARVNMEPSGTSLALASFLRSNRKNPIYLFYERVDHNAQGKPGYSGDKHYRCWHEDRRVFTITAAMKYCLQSLVAHIRSSHPTQYALYVILKKRRTPPTAEELEAVEARRALSEQEVSALSQLASPNEHSMSQSFAHQTRALQGTWNQGHFEKLLAEWIVTCNKPLDMVDQIEFRELLQYAYRGDGELHIPCQTSIKSLIHTDRN